MNIMECYAELHEDYDSVLRRLRKQERIEKFFIKITEIDMLGQIRTALDAKDYEAVFSISHDLKGMTLSLGLLKLAMESSKLCECFRQGEPKVDTEPFYMATLKEYAEVLKVSKKLKTTAWNGE